MYMEAAAKEGKFVGYVKPFIRDLDVLDWKGQDKSDNFLRKRDAAGADTALRCVKRRSDVEG